MLSESEFLPFDVQCDLLKAERDAIAIERDSLYDRLRAREQECASLRSELQKWQEPDRGGERLAAMYEQYASNPRSLAAAVGYVAALEHALGHARRDLEALREGAQEYARSRTIRPREDDA